MLLDVVTIMAPFSGTDFPCQASVHRCEKYSTEINIQGRKIYVGSWVLIFWSIMVEG